MDVAALRMRESTIAAGIWLTYGIGGFGELYVLLTWERPHRLGLACLFALATLAAAIVSMLPKERIVRSRLREPFFLSWTMLDFVMLVIGTLADGGTTSPLVLVFFIPVVFSSMSYPLVSVITVGIVSVFSYLLVALLTSGSNWAYEVAFAISLACTAAMSAWQASNHNRQHRVLAKVSRTDPLTGCLNRRGFEERALAELSAMTRSGGTGAMLMLDIDHFKPVNDIFGHAAGDELLCWVSDTLRRTARSSDVVGRLGGDEFAVLFPEMDYADARASATRVGEALSKRAPASLGLAFFPDDGADLEELSRHADMRLYDSRKGRSDGSSADDEQRSARAQARGKGAAEGVEGPENPGFGPIDLWRAALDAMPVRAGGSAEPTGQASLEAALLDQIDASVVVTDMTGVVISWNRGAEALYGWSEQEAVGHAATELMVPEDTQQAEQLFVELRRDGRWDGELSVRRRDGSPFTAYVRNRLILDAEGRPSAVVGVAVDISARVAAETELLHSRDYAHAVTECMGEGLFTLDVAGRVTYINRTAEQLLGWAAHELSGEVLLSLIQPPAAGGPRAIADGHIARALGGEATVRVEDDVFVTHSGRQLPVAYTAAPFRTDGQLQGCVVIFQDITERKHQEEAHKRDLATLACIDRVEHALAEERLVLHAQPIVDLDSGETVQHELLLRMREPDGEIVPPGDFLPAAERYALIGEIDWWVIKQATQIAGAGCPVELNISARSVGDLDVLGHIERCIEHYGVPRGSLVFEITETAIVEDEGAACLFAERLHELGCKVALDDFGTGYGSLTYLKQIPVDYLKLDIEFVRDVVTNSASRHVVEAVIALARDFHVETVAEGVEDAAALTLLRELGVDHAQGYHLARPAPFSVRPGDQSEPVRIAARESRRESRRAPARRLAAAGRRRS
jgi:diguanylate cyclase (GGDEF)-like protein/PAS domain S-box-containing protein